LSSTFGNESARCVASVIYALDKRLPRNAPLQCQSFRANTASVFIEAFLKMQVGLNRSIGLRVRPLAKPQ